MSIIQNIISTLKGEDEVDRAFSAVGRQYEKTLRDVQRYEQNLQGFVANNGIQNQNIQHQHSVMVDQYGNIIDPHVTPQYQYQQNIQPHQQQGPSTTDKVLNVLSDGKLIGAAATVVTVAAQIFVAMRKK